MPILAAALRRADDAHARAHAVATACITDVLAPLARALGAHALRVRAIVRGDGVLAHVDATDGSPLDVYALVRVIRDGGRTRLACVAGIAEGGAHEEWTSGPLDVADGAVPALIAEALLDVLRAGGSTPRLNAVRAAIAADCGRAPG